MSAYDEGIEAYRRGEDFTENPHQWEDDEFEEWDNGWWNEFKSNLPSEKPI